MASTGEYDWQKEYPVVVCFDKDEANKYLNDVRAEADKVRLLYQTRSIQPTPGCNTLDLKMESSDTCYFISEVDLYEKEK